MRTTPDLVAASLCAKRMAAAAAGGSAATRAWRALPQVAQFEQALLSCVNHPPQDAAALRDRLAEWMTGEPAWLHDFACIHLRAMRQDPFASFGMRTSPQAVANGIALFLMPGLDVTLSWIDHAALAAHKAGSLVLSPTFSLVHVVRSGNMKVREFTLQSADGAPVLRPATVRSVQAGELICIDNRTQAQQMLAGDAGDSTDTVLLRVALQLPERSAYREFSIATGQMLREGLGDDGASRMLPLLSVARLSGQARRAAPVLRELSYDENPMLRWSAMREWTVAEPAAAKMRLAEMVAQDADAGVREAARATLAFLEQQAALNASNSAAPRREDAPCPA